MKTIRFLILLLILLITSNFIFAENYADIKIDVLNEGSVNINGITNYEKFKDIYLSQEYTSKNKEFWVLNITTKEVFENFVYEITLPENSQINYIKTIPTFRIVEKNNRLKIIGFGENKTIQTIVQYKIENEAEENLNIYTILIILTLFTILLFFYIYYHKHKLNKLRNQEQTNKNNSIQTENKEISYLIKDISIFSKRQQDIINILIKKEKITQKELEKIMEIPKSSISRNIKTLENKKIIKKERIGNTNYLFLNK